MALDEYYDNGILKTLLAKNIDNVPVPLYPKSSADIINYEDTTVLEKIKGLDRLITNIQSLVASVSSDVSSLNVNTYDKEYINTIQNDINDALTEIRSSIITINQTLNGYSFYSKLETNDIVSQLTGSINNAFNILDKKIDDLNTYLVNGYHDSTTVDDYVGNLYGAIETAKNGLKNLMDQTLIDFKGEINSFLLNTLSEYYDKEDVDTLLSDMIDNVSELHSELASIRSDSEYMNNQAVIDINNHINEKNSDILTRIDEKIENNLASMERQVQTQTEDIGALFETVIGAINAVNSSVAAQISAIEASSSAITYDNADEEEY